MSRILAVVLMLWYVGGMPTYAAERPIESVALVGHIMGARDQPVMVGQDSFEEWSVYDLQIVARPAGQSFENTGGTGKTISIYAPRSLSDASRSGECYPAGKSDDLYLVFLTKTTGRGSPPQQGVYLLSSCVLIDPGTMYGFLKD